MPSLTQKHKELPRLPCAHSNLLLFRAQRNWRVPHGSTPHSGRCTVLLHPSEHRCPILSTLSESLSKQLVSVLGVRNASPAPPPTATPQGSTSSHWAHGTRSDPLPAHVPAPPLRHVPGCIA